MLKRKSEIYLCGQLKNYKLDNQQPSPDEGKVQRLLPEMVLGTSVPKWKPSKGIYIPMMNDIVCTLMEVRENLFLRR